MNPQPVKTSFPRTRLSQLAARSGGIAREQAVEAAMESVESLRGEGDEAIKSSIAAIEAIMNHARNGQLATDRIQEILPYADQIVTLAATFGYDSLAKVMRSLCDVADGLIRAGLRDAAPIAVHVQSMLLLMPGSTALSAEQVEVVLGELAKVLTHYNFGSIAGQDTLITSEDVFAEPG
jgi:hypothetical protein